MQAAAARRALVSSASLRSASVWASVLVSASASASVLASVSGLVSGLVSALASVSASDRDDPGHDADRMCARWSVNQMLPSGPIVRNDGLAIG